MPRKQLTLFSESVAREFGGSLLLGRRKTVRPLDTRKSLHLVLKAVDSFKLLRNRSLVERNLRSYAKRFELQIYDLAVNADHIHLQIKFSRREDYVRWIRAVTGAIARKIAGLKWKLRPYSKILSWGKQFALVRRYILTNQNQGSLISDVIAHADHWELHLAELKAQLRPLGTRLVELVI